ncbi:MAG: metallophosphoesterase family protein [Acidimicrobiales bacterium]
MALHRPPRTLPYPLRWLLPDLAAGRISSLRRLSVAAVEDTTVQVSFAAPPGRLDLQITGPATNGRPADPSRQGPGLEHRGGPAVVVIDQLQPDQPIQIRLGAADPTRTLTVRTRTLPRPPGPELARIVTISDLHLGSVAHGLARTMVDRSPHPDPAPVRCARGAITDAAAWNPTLLVAKGDLTQNGFAEEWRLLGQLLDTHGPGLARLGLPGNHDTPRRRNIDATRGLELAGFPHQRLAVGEPEWRDLEGVRVVALDSTVAHQSQGTLAPQWQHAIDLAAEAAAQHRAVLLCLHHPLERAPVQLQYPKGVAWAEGRAFAQALHRANPRSLITAGHTHRNRKRKVGPLIHTEVASTKDWPGVWGGYAIHEGGIRQVVRRISDPEALGWLDYTRWAALGLWWPYSPGRLSERCFTLRW